MKKKMMAIAGAFVLLVGGGAAFVATQNNTLDPNSLLAQNIEALSQTEAVDREDCEYGGYYCAEHIVTQEGYYDEYLWYWKKKTGWL